MARVSHRETYRNTITYALSIVGGSEPMLAEKLGVRVGELVNYLTGVEEVPTPAFLKAVDVVLAATADDIRQARRSSTSCATSAASASPSAGGRRYGTCFSGAMAHGGFATLSSA